MMHAENNVFQTKIHGPIHTYPEFLSWVEQLTSEGKTSGPNQTAALVGYTALNHTRMKRISKTLRLDAALLDVLQHTHPQNWMVITEAWCGDSAQNLPILAAMAEASGGKISLHIILRDENPEIMDRYLTHGGRSIPKLVAFNPDGSERFNWGPRPAAAQQLFTNWKHNPEGKSWPDFETDLHTWYARNKGSDVQQELMELLK